MATITTTKQQISNAQGSCEFKWEEKLVKCLQNCLNPRSIKYIINIIFPFLLVLPEKGYYLPPWFQEALNKVSKDAENMKVTLSEESKRPGLGRVQWQQWGPHLQNTEQDPWQQAPLWGPGNWRQDYGCECSEGSLLGGSSAHLPAVSQTFQAQGQSEWKGKSYQGMRVLSTKAKFKYR